MRHYLCLFLLVFIIFGISNTFALSKTPNQGINAENAIDSLYEKAKAEKEISDKAYHLSIPLLGSAQRQDATRYPKMQKSLADALKQLPSSSFKAWLTGRALFAAQSMPHQTEAVKHLTKELKTLLAAEKKSKADEFYAWSLGYLALSKDGYDAKQMEAANNDVTNQYDAELKKADRNEKKIQSARSNALWAWVMTLQAAARQPDIDTYKKACTKIKTIAGAESMGEALQGIPETDFRAWAMSIVSFAAATIQDNMLYRELQIPLKKAMQAAKDIQDETKQPNADLMLARVNTNLADVCFQTHEQQAANTADHHHSNSPQYQ